MKVIFLDVDGVLNGAASTSQCRGMVGIDGDKVRRLRSIVEQTGARIVLISSWKEEWYREPDKKEWQDESANYLDRKLRRERLHAIDKTDDTFCERGESILRWLRKIPRVERFAILDDETFDYDACGLMPYLVRTNEQTGLTEADVRAAVELLGTE